jgi:signal transduction histidine kinase
VLSGLKDEKIALETVRSGAQDFILKGEYNGSLLEKTITYSIERKRNQELLTASNQKYIELFQSSPLPLFIVEPNSQCIVQSNLAASKLFGYASSEFEEFKFDKIVYNDRRTENVLHFLAEKKNGELILVRVNKQKTHLDKNEYDLIQLEDITEQIKFEQNRMSMVNSIQDSERENFAMELHDGLAQELVLINLYMEQIKKKSTDLPEIKKIQDIVNSTMTQIRRLNYNVSPPALDEGLFESLIVLFDRFDSVNEMNITIEFKEKERLTKDSLTAETAYNSFRIIQEFLNNSIKHSLATEIKAEIEPESDYVSIKVIDNGVGFEKKDKHKRGMGISNMTKRAEVFNIDLEINSSMETGTKLSLKIPCARIDSNEI